MGSQFSAIEKIIAPAVEALGYELYACQLITGKKTSTLRVYVDSEKGITLDDCEAVSRQVANLLDVEDPLEGRYMLEVSSPGMERPLMYDWHFERAVGKLAKMKLRQPVQGQRHLQGVIVAVEKGQISLETPEFGTVQFGLDLVDKARLVCDFGSSVR